MSKQVFLYKVIVAEGEIEFRILSVGVNTLNYLSYQLLATR